MAEIKLQKRVVYAGDVHIALLKAGWGIKEAVDFVKSLPEADVAPVRRGEWQGTADGYADGQLVYDIWNCCSRCGAQIDWQTAERNGNDERDLETNNRADGR